MSETSNTVAPKALPFMAFRKLAALLSIVLLIGSVVSLSVNGLKFGLDFTGGTLVEVGYSEPVPLSEVRQTLEGAGYHSAVVVNFGTDTDVLVRLPQGLSAKLGDEVVAALKADFAGEIDLRRVEYVGPQVGEELREQGGLAMLLALAVVMVYVAMRFQVKFAVGAVAALAHDVIIALGAFSLIGWEFDLTVLAALLAVIGYSLNDTIVVSDRIRENFRKLRKSEPSELIDISLTETLARTVVTSLTTLLVLLALFFFGGEMIHSFSIALIIGVVVGTYSSVYVSANVLMAMKISKEDLMLPAKEGELVDDLP